MSHVINMGAYSARPQAGRHRPGTRRYRASKERAVRQTSSHSFDTLNEYETPLDLCLPDLHSNTSRGLSNLTKSLITTTSPDTATSTRQCLRS